MNLYLLSVHMVEGEEAPSEEVMQKAYKDVGALNQEMQAKGAWVFGGGLEPADVATVVREQNGEVLTTDGPFSEAKEHIGGFWILRAADLTSVGVVFKKARSRARVPSKSPLHRKPRPVPGVRPRAGRRRLQQEG